MRFGEAYGGQQRNANARRNKAEIHLTLYSVLCWKDQVEEDGGGQYRGGGARYLLGTVWRGVCYSQMSKTGNWGKIGLDVSPFCLSEAFQHFLM